LLAEEQKKKDKAQQAVKAQERDARLQAYLKRKAEEETQDEKADFWVSKLSCLQGLALSRQTLSLRYTVTVTVFCVVLL